MRHIKHIVVHCTATQQTATLDQIRAAWKAQGWLSPGYHIVVFPDGRWERIAPDSAICNGVRGHNASSLHIAYIGGINQAGKPVDNRTPQQKETLLKRLSEWKVAYPTATIKGHRDFSPDKNGNGRVDPVERIKECPCFDAVEEYKFL